MKKVPAKASPARIAKSDHVTTQSDRTVASYLRDLDHPPQNEIESVRKIILGASPRIREGIKWNAPSFLTTDYFATLNNPPAKDRVMLILHTGAKRKGGTMKGKISDPAGLLKWLAKDRCLVTFSDAKDVRAKSPALRAIVREWIALL